MHARLSPFPTDFGGRNVICDKAVPETLSFMPAAVLWTADLLRVKQQQAQSELRGMMQAQQHLCMCSRTHVHRELIATRLLAGVCCLWLGAQRLRMVRMCVCGFRPSGRQHADIRNRRTPSDQAAQQEEDQAALLWREDLRDFLSRQVEACGFCCCTCAQVYSSVLIDKRLACPSCSRLQWVVSARTRDCRNCIEEASRNVLAS